MTAQKHTPGPWEYVPGTESHGPYVAGPYGGDIADCYCMSNPLAASIRNGGDSYPVLHQGEQAEANARLIAAAPDFIAAAKDIIASRSDTYRARNGRRMGIEDDSGEKVWLVPFDEMLALEAAIAKAEGRP